MEYYLNYLKYFVVLYLNIYFVLMFLQLLNLFHLKLNLNFLFFSEEKLQIIVLNYNNFLLHLINKCNILLNIHYMVEMIFLILNILFLKNLDLVELFLFLLMLLLIFLFHLNYQHILFDYKINLNHLNIDLNQIDHLFYLNYLLYFLFLLLFYYQLNSMLLINQ